MDKKRLKLDCLPSTSKASAGEPEPGPGQGEGPDDDSLNPTTGTGNGGENPDADSRWLHPLRMPEILAHVFNLCSPEDLPSCRLVSKAWVAESLKVWRSSATLQFHYPGGKEIFLTSGGGVAQEEEEIEEVEKEEEEDEEDEDRNKTSLTEFLKFWKTNCSSKPFRRFNLSKWEFALGGPAKTTKGYMTNRFWKLTGSNMTSLKLSGCVFSGAPVLRKIIYKACPNLRDLNLDGCSHNRMNRNFAPITPNEAEYRGAEHGQVASLQSLSIYMKESGGYRRSPFLPISWLELLSHFPALTTLSLSFELTYRAEYLEHIRQLVGAINLVRNRKGNNGIQFQIRKVCIHMDSSMRHSASVHNYVESREILQLLQGVNIPLELNFLSVSLSQGDVSFAMETIASSRTSLRILEALEAVGDTGTDIWDFPFDTDLPNLDTLKMSHRFCRSMQFLKYTPNLKELRIKGQRTPNENRGGSLKTHLVSQTFLPELANLKLLNLKEFYFDHELTDGELTSLIGWLPNVQILTMYLKDSQFAIVCDQWRNLEHLHVLGGKLTDVGITGRREEGAEEVLPNITNLKGLKCFQIPYEGSMLTDVSAFEGFLKLPDLQILDIISARNKFGDQAFADLLSKIPYCKLDTGYRRLPSSIPTPIRAFPRFYCSYYFVN